MTAQERTDGQASSDATVVVAAASQLTRTAVRDALSNAGYEVVATPATHADTVDALADVEPAVAVVASSIAEDERAMDALATGWDASLVALTTDGWDPSAADRVVSTDSDRSLAVIQNTASVVDAVAEVADATDTPRWKRVMEGTRTETDRDQLPVGDRELATRPVLLVGASTGGPSLVTRLLAELPWEADFRGFVVQHIREGFGERFVDRLDAASAYDVVAARDGAVVEPGELMVAVPGQHLEIEARSGAGLRVATSDAPPMHGVRPAIDPTFETAASVADGPLVAVQLTGMGEDGAAGVRAVDDAGGTTVVQDPADATVASMPEAALSAATVDRIVETDRLGRAVLDAVTVRR